MKPRHMRGIHLSKKVIIIALIMIAVGGGVAAYLWQQSARSPKTKDDGSSAANDEPYDYPKQSGESATAAKIIDDYASGAATLGDTQAKLRAGEKSATNPADKAAYALAAIDIQTQAGNDQQALTLALAAETNYKTVDTAATVAALYESLSQYANAAKYYQLAADRSEKTTDPTIRSPYNDYMNSKKEAEAKL